MFKTCQNSRECFHTSTHTTEAHTHKLVLLKFRTYVTTTNLARRRVQHSLEILEQQSEALPFGGFFLPAVPHEPVEERRCELRVVEPIAGLQELHEVRRLDARIRGSTKGEDLPEKNAKRPPVCVFTRK